MSTLSALNLSKHFGAVKAVDDVSFEVTSGEFLALLGPSGSGKTTILRLIGGFEEATEGQIHIDDRDVRNLPPHKRNIGVVFQKYALFPHMTVANNVAYPLQRRKTPRHERERKLAEVLDLVGLSGFEKRYPNQLSGGQQQRVALARAMVFQPDILLMDEPLGALDKQLRERMQFEIRSLQERVGITTIYVTHDQTEAMAMADRIGVVHDGRIEQIAPPAEVYNNPATRFVAEFIGNSNLIECTPIESNGAYLTLRIGQDISARCPARNDDRVSLMLVRPEKIRAAGTLSPSLGENAIEGRIDNLTFLGDQTHMRVNTAVGLLSVIQQNFEGAPKLRKGDAVWLHWAVGDTAVLP
jgi:spermidine/putrescine ABC transporter ATP-binding subunit